MSNGSDKRLSSRRWKNLRARVLRRDLHRCQWRLDGCTDFADNADHVIPRIWLDEQDPRYWDERNLVASCGPCNRKRPHLRPGERGAYGSTPDAPRRFGGDPGRPRFFSERPPARGGLAIFPPQSRWLTVTADYSRKAQDDGDSAA